jgi:hypothetical protein
MENVFMTTTERKRMSTKTTFKRIALVAVAALGLGVLSVAPTQAVIFNESLTIGSATATAYVGDTATTTLTHVFGATFATAGANMDSSTVRYTCTAPTGATCPAVIEWMTDTSDTANVTVNLVNPTYRDMSASSGQGFTDSATSTTGTARAVHNIKATGFAKAGTYTYSFYSTKSGVSDFGVTGSSAPTWTVTVSAVTAGAATQILNKYISNDAAGAANTARLNRAAYRASSDSSVTCAAGLTTTNSYCATAAIVIGNAAGESKTVVGSNTVFVQESVTATISGAGTLSNDGGSNKSTSVVLNVLNGASPASTEELTIWTNGYAGVATITYTTPAGVSLGTQTVTFTGTPASAYPYFVAGDTVVSLTSGAPVIKAVVKDSGLNVLKKGTLYLYSSDTKVAGDANSNYTTQKVTTNTCSPATVDVSTVFTCSAITISDTGTATFVLRDSYTVTGSTWASSGITLTVTGDVIKTLTVAFDKATYAPGERAVITLTAKDAAGVGMATGGTNAYASVLATPTLTSVLTAPVYGTRGTSDGIAATTISSWLDSGVETRVVVMPTVGGSVTYSVKHLTFGDIYGGYTTVTASATVADPTKDAADAATDAALEATDAAYAAQDAAQLAAEAADAATAAAEAATAAVEDLATQVASLFADLQKQITTLANVVAKIAKKVKA